MVDAVSTVSLQSAVLRSSPQAADAASVIAPASAASIDLVTSAIVVDNLQNMAILEYRSSKTGEIVQQYPTEAQIRAFKSAVEIQRAVAQHEDVAPQRATSASTNTAPDPAPVHVSAPVHVAAPAPTGGADGAHSVLA